MARPGQRFWWSFAMMSMKEVFVRTIVYGLVLSVVDAVSGRFFQASPDPNVLLALGAVAWAGYQLARSGQDRVAIPAALSLFAAYATGFVIWAELLVGWNRSVPWSPRSAAWVVWIVCAALVVAVVARLSGMGARAATTAAQSNGA
jgi:hypothetical protein